MCGGDQSLHIHKIVSFVEETQANLVLKAGPWGELKENPNIDIQTNKLNGYLGNAGDKTARVEHLPREVSHYGPSLLREGVRLQDKEGSRHGDGVVVGEFDEGPDQSSRHYFQ